VRYALIACVLSWVGGFAIALALWLCGVRSRFGLGTFVADAAMLATLLPLLRSRSLSLRDLGLRRVPGARSVGYVLLALIGVSLFEMYWRRAVIRHPLEVSNFFGISHRSAGVIVLGAFAASISAPVVEEVFFRGLVYRSLRNRLPVLAAALIDGTIFGLAHAGSYPVDTLPAKAFFGVVMCLLYERTGSLLPGIALHSFIDASDFNIALSGTNTIVLLTFLSLAVALLATGAWAELRRLHLRCRAFLSGAG
jgi:membrane protease YdiL (CAAX protease family)